MASSGSEKIQGGPICLGLSYITFSFKFLSDCDSMAWVPKQPTKNNFQAQKTAVVWKAHV